MGRSFTPEKTVYHHRIKPQKSARFPIEPHTGFTHNLPAKAAPPEPVNHGHRAAQTTDAAILKSAAPPGDDPLAVHAGLLGAARP